METHPSVKQLIEKKNLDEETVKAFLAYVYEFYGLEPSDPISEESFGLFFSEFLEDSVN